MSDKSAKLNVRRHLGAKRPSSEEKQKAATLTADEPLISSIKNNAPIVKSKKVRKRAADFLSEDEDQGKPQPLNVTDSQSDTKKVKFADSNDVQPVKKNKKSREATSITQNGVAKTEVERKSISEPSVATSKSPAATSLVAEAQRTTEKELEDDFRSFSNGVANTTDIIGGVDDHEEDIDHAPNLLTGLDSDTEDPAQDRDLDITKLGAMPNYKKTQKKLMKAKREKTEGAGVVYIGRIPHGFYEQQMREYFSQFGEMTRLRLSRNKRTGASKHFAFIEFKSDEVAKIVAETMDNYLMFGHILKCKYVPQDSLHPDVWKGANKRYRRIPHERLERENLAAPKSQSYWQKKVEKEKKKREHLAAKLKEIDYEMPQSTLTDPTKVVSQRKLQNIEDNTPKQIENQTLPPAAAIEPAKNAANTADTLEQPQKRKSNKKMPADVVPPTQKNHDTKDSHTKNGKESISGESRSGSQGQSETAPIPINTAVPDTVNGIEKPKTNGELGQEEDAGGRTTKAADSTPVVESNPSSQIKAKNKPKKTKKVTS